MCLIRAFLDNCSLLAADHRHLLDRRTHESCTLRQLFDRRGTLVRLYLGVPIVVTAPRPISNFASAEEVDATRDIPIPDLSPIEPWGTFQEAQVYRDENNFPIRSMEHSAPHTVMGESKAAPFIVGKHFHDLIYTLQEFPSTTLETPGGTTPDTPASA